MSRTYQASQNPAFGKGYRHYFGRAKIEDLAWNTGKGHCIRSETLTLILSQRKQILNFSYPDTVLPRNWQLGGPWYCGVAGRHLHAPPHPNQAQQSRGITKRCILENAAP